MSCVTELESYFTVLSACRRLQRIRLIFCRWQAIGAADDVHALHRYGWKRLVAYTLQLPGTVETVTVDFSCGPVGGGTAGALVLTEGLPCVQDLRDSFEEAIVGRQRTTRVCLLPGGKPMFSLAEQAALRALFPVLSARGLLDF